jgi:hypothetical protein
MSGSRMPAKSTSLRVSFFKIALTVFAAQLAFILIVTLLHWQNLCRWDGDWYAHIVDHGYVSELPPSVQIKDKGNVAFFPLYPLLAAGVKKITGLTAESSLILTAQAFALGVWFYFLWVASFFASEGESQNEKIPAHWSIENLHEDAEWGSKNSFIWSHLKNRLYLFALYPYSFFFMVSYSESVFIFCLLGFIFWVERWVRATGKKEQLFFYLLALAHGIALTSARLVGVFLIIYPVIRVFLAEFSQTHLSRRLVFRRLWPAIFLTLASSAGAALFFLYCQLKFGAWNLYFTTVKIGWNEYTDIHELLPPLGLIQMDWNHLLKSDNIGRLLTIAVIIFQLFALAKQLRRKNYADGKLALLLVSMITLWGTMYGRSSYRFAGFGRYLLPVLALLFPWVKLPKLQKNIFTYALLIVLLAFQFFFIAMFARRGWVA